MKKIILVLTVICMSFVSCEQYITREYGGTTIIKLEKGQKLIECTWKGDGDLWYLVEPMDSDYVPKTKEFIESSMIGVMEGKVIFVESR